MKPIIDLTGQRFGRLSVVSRSFPNYKGHTRWLCRCDCGTELPVGSGNLRQGLTNSCGCLMREVVTQKATKHGQAGSRLYRIWGAMRERCTRPGAINFKHYGGRGIRVCDRWQSFENFQADMGASYASHLTIDRINNDGNYEPGNCRWATRAEQRTNQRPRRRAA